MEGKDPCTFNSTFHLLILIRSPKSNVCSRSEGKSFSFLSYEMACRCFSGVRRPQISMISMILQLGFYKACFFGKRPNHRETAMAWWPSPGRRVPCTWPETTLPQQQPQTADCALCLLASLLAAGSSQEHTCKMKQRAEYISFGFKRAPSCFMHEHFAKRHAKNSPDPSINCNMRHPSP